MSADVACATPPCPPPATDDDVLLRLENLVKYFPVQARQPDPAGKGRSCTRSTA